MITLWKRLILTLLVSSVGVAFAASSRFVVINPANEAQHPFSVQVRSAADGDRSRIRIVWANYRDQRAWLVVCRAYVHPSAVRSRNVFWFDERDENIERFIQLFPEQTSVSESGERSDSYVELELPNEQLRRAFVYIDFPRPVDDGGDYYAIDLAYYLRGALGKKSVIQWGTQ